MENRNPLADWLTSTSTTRCGLQSHPSDALYFFLDGGRKLIAKQSYDVIQMARRFSILNTRFRYTIDRTNDFDWRYPFSAEFPLLDAIERCTPEDLAKSITASATTLFSRVSIEDVIRYGPTVEAITAHRSELSDNVAACLIADSNFAEYMTELARVR